MICNVGNGVGQGLSISNDTICTLMVPYDEFRDLDGIQG
jgi:hypothetical protein